MGKTQYSLIIPVYKNEDSIEILLERTHDLYEKLEQRMEAIFVVDGSPDNSYHTLQNLLPKCSFPAELISLSKNFGSADAIRMGLSIAHGEYFAAMAADLQEPADLFITLFNTLEKEPIDIAVGTRTNRKDPISSKITANFFWAIYKKLVQPDMPSGGIDIFSCNKKVRTVLLSLRESNSSLTGQLIWLGFRRKEIPYKRQARKIGKSSWSFRRKVRYMLDSIFSFTDLPITLITFLGCIGLLSTTLLGVGVLISWYTGSTKVPGYTPLILSILFSMSLTLIALGIIGHYVWRSYENTKQRPMYLPMLRESFSQTTSEKNL